MNSLDPIAMLEAEHRVILKIVGAMAVLADVIEAGQDKRKPVESVLEFLQTYVGRCHHIKEEQHLFPALAARGVPTQGCPIGVLVHEHQKLHALVEDLSQATQKAGQADQAPREAIVRCLRELAAMYPGHIWKEDYLLFPMSRKVCQQGDLDALGTKFCQVDDQIGPQDRRRLEDLAERLYEESMAAAS